MGFWNRKSKRDHGRYISFRRLQTEKQTNTKQLHSKNVKSPNFFKSVKIIAKSLDDLKMENWHESVWDNIRSFTRKLFRREE